MIKIGTQNREISQVLSQVLEYFFGGVYKFLGRFEKWFFEYYVDGENSVDSTTAISAESSVLWKNPILFDNTPDSYAINYLSNRNSFKLADFVNIISSLQNDYQHNYTDENYNLRRKEKLYFSASKRSRQWKHRKIKKLPTVGKMPTIFESYPYPLPLEDFMATAEETFLPRLLKHNLNVNHFWKKKLACTLSKEEEIDINSTLNEPAFIPIIEVKSNVISSIDTTLESRTKIESELYEEPSLLSTTEMESIGFSLVTEQLALTSTIEQQSDIVSLEDSTLIPKIEVEPAVVLPITEETSASSTKLDQVAISPVEVESYQNSGEISI